MMLWPLLFVSLVMAEDFSIERYCFSTQLQAAKASGQLKAISVSSDKVESDGFCLVVTMRPHRRELIQKYLLSNYPNMSISFSDQALKRDPCELKIERVKTTQANNIDIRANHSGIIKTHSSTKTAPDTFHITTLKQFEISVDQDRVLGECRYITPLLYEISLMVAKDPIPGPTSPTLPNQETSMLKTQVQLQRGSRIQISSVIRNLKEQSRQINTDPQIKVSDGEKKMQETVFLSIN